MPAAGYRICKQCGQTIEAKRRVHMKEKHNVDTKGKSLKDFFTRITPPAKPASAKSATQAVSKKA